MVVVSVVVVSATVVSEQSPDSKMSSSVLDQLDSTGTFFNLGGLALFPSVFVYRLQKNKQLFKKII